MGPLTNDWLLEAWDRGAVQNSLDRALTLLECAWPRRRTADIETLSIAARDLELLRVRQRAFGDTLRGFATCESCGASLEFETKVEALLRSLESAQPRAVEEWTKGDLVFSMRPVNSQDLKVAAAATDLSAARRELLERCASMRTTDGSSTSRQPIAAEFENTAIERFEHMNQGAELLVALACPNCGRSYKALFDIAQFLWAEVRSAAAGLLRQVHELASAYGWSEAAILRMSPARRAMYLEMTRS